MKSLHCLIGAGCLVAGVDVASAQGPPIFYDRVIRAAAVAPGDGGPDQWVVSTVFSVRAHLLPSITEGAVEGGPVDVSTTVVVMINGAPVGMDAIQLSINPLSVGPCGGVSCGQGATNGMAASLLCLEGGCQFPPLTASVPIPAPSPGDEIQIMLIPSPGAIAEVDPQGDRWEIDFDGEFVGWNRRIKNVSITPSGASGGQESTLYDVHFDLEYAQFGMTAHADLGIKPMLLVNGEPTNAPFAGCTNWIASPSSECTIICDADCGTANCGGSSSDLDCRPTENDYGQLFCACIGELAYSFLGVELSPGDEVMVIVRPSISALPELPGFDNDNTGAPAPGCPQCPADLTGDGVIDGADLARLLANWGICFPL